MSPSQKNVKKRNAFVNAKHVFRALVVSKFSLFFILVMFVIPLSAFEAHVVNVTATIEMPPPGGACEAAPDRTVVWFGMSEDFVDSIVASATVVSAVPPSAAGLVAHWPMDENGGPTANDSSGNGHAGTLVNNAAWVPGRINSALSFDGNDDYVNINDSNDLDLTGDFTISAWIYPRTWGQSDQGRIVDHGGGAGPLDGWTFQLSRTAFNTNGLGLQVADAAGGFGGGSNSNVIGLNKWQHVAVTLKANDRFDFYVDGAPAGAKTSGVRAVAAASVPIRLGIRADDLNRDFNGAIDNVRIYDRALSGAEVQALYDEGTPQDGPSDDFNSAVLDPAFTFHDPVGDSSYSLTENPGHLRIKALAGSAHDCWNSGANCPRMMRSFDNADAVYETKIDGVNLGQQFQTQGIQLMQDNSNYLRFEYWTDGSVVRANAFKIISGSGSQTITGPIVSQTGTNYLKVIRRGSTFALQYSIDGLTWIDAGAPFSVPGFSVTSGGLYVINTGANPETVGDFDYFSRFSIGREDFDVPTASQNLRARAVLGSQVNLAWTSFPPFLSAYVYGVDYEVLRSQNPGGPFTSLGFTTLTKFYDKSVSPGSTYYYKIRGHNRTKVLLSNSTEAAAMLTRTGVHIATGIYDIHLGSFDAHSRKPNQVQPKESWFLILKDADGNVVATTTATTDLPATIDRMEELAMTDFAVPVDITTLVVYHAAYRTNNPNSVIPVCAAFDWVGEFESEPEPEVEGISINSEEGGEATSSEEKAGFVLREENASSTPADSASSTEPTAGNASSTIDANAASTENSSSTLSENASTSTVPENAASSTESGAEENSSSTIAETNATSTAEFPATSTEPIATSTADVAPPTNETSTEKIAPPENGSSTEPTAGATPPAEPPENTT